VRLYDSLRETAVELSPPDRVIRMYVCGITPYDTTHLGHARVNIVFDAMLRFLELRGFTTRYVQNVTDIDDDILRKAKQVGLAWDELGRRETERYLRDLDALNVRRPTFYVKATETVPEMVAIVEDLLSKELAYEREGNVYFDVSADPTFGQLAHMAGYDELLRVANERGNFPDDPLKNAPLDFVLWQAGKPGEPTWESPWGPGRPGWHIECSAMALKYLGPQIEIHGGGGDLQFPHHASEIAQTEAHTELQPFVQCWAHIGMVRLDGEKMSKSLGNLVLAADLLKRYSPEAIRLAVLRYPYRAGYDYVEDDMRWGEELVERWRAAAGQALERAQLGSRSAAALHERALTALDEDFDTPGAIAALTELADAVLAGAIDDPRAAGAALRELAGVLGIQLR
jgi:cysteinyl-tRNA synthetase